MKLRGIECYGEAYPGQNYQLIFEDEELDYTFCTSNANNWSEVLDEVETRHASLMPVEISAV